MPSLKEVKDKIASVENTRKITSTMNMVASAKLKKAQGRIEQFRPYAEKFYDLLGNLASGVGADAHPLLEAREEINNVGILLITSERGLCGAFNSNLIQKAQNLAWEKQQQGKAPKFYCVGKKGRYSIQKSEYELLNSYIDCMDNFDFTLASSLGQEIINSFQAADLDEVHLVYGKFVSVLKQIPTCLQILPISAEGIESAESGAEYTYEPSAEGILNDLLPRFINVQIYRGLLETSASEHAARMAAMDNATQNCDDMISDLTLTYNKARQAAITSELLDIVGGAEALKG